MPLCFSSTGILLITITPCLVVVSRSQTAFTRKGSGTMPMRSLCRTPRNWGVDNCIPHQRHPATARPQLPVLRSWLLIFLPKYAFRLAKSQQRRRNHLHKRCCWDLASLKAYFGTIFVYLWWTRDSWFTQHR